MPASDVSLQDLAARARGGNAGAEAALLRRVGPSDRHGPARFHGPGLRVPIRVSVRSLALPPDSALIERPVAGLSGGTVLLRGGQHLAGVGAHHAEARFEVALKRAPDPGAEIVTPLGDALVLGHANLREVELRSAADGALQQEAQLPAPPGRWRPAGDRLVGLLGAGTKTRQLAALDLGADGFATELWRRKVQAPEHWCVSPSRVLLSGEWGVEARSVEDGASLWTDDRPARVLEADARGALLAGADGLEERDPATGTLRWRWPLEGRVAWAALGAEQVVCTTARTVSFTLRGQDGRSQSTSARVHFTLQALDRADGGLLFEQNADAERPPFGVADDVLYRAGAADTRLVVEALDTASGARLFTEEVELPEPCAAAPRWTVLPGADAVRVACTLRGQAPAVAWATLHGE